MDDNVMRRYCELAEAAREVVQFDQGELRPDGEADAAVGRSSLAQGRIVAELRSVFRVSFCVVT